MKTKHVPANWVNLIRRGIKTVVIRPLDPQPPPLLARKRDDGMWVVSWLGVDPLGRGAWFAESCPWGAPGDVVGMNLSSETPLHVCITDTRIERLDQIDEATWARADFADKGRRRDAWDAIFGGSVAEWSRAPYVWVIRFELVTETTGDEL